MFFFIRLTSICVIVVYLDKAKLSVPSDDNFGIDLNEMIVAFLDSWMIQYTMKKQQMKTISQGDISE